MRFIAIIAAAAALAVLLGCTHAAPQSRSYYATIERVVEKQGDFFSPAKGHRPLRYLYLRIQPADPGREGGLRVQLLENYLPEFHGRQGDRVAFSYPGDLPAHREVDFDSLLGYRILTDSR
jgi:hypothetical protein